MTAFFIATIKVKNAEKFQEYGSKVPATIAAFGGELITRGQVKNVLVGNADNQVAAIVSFPDMEALQGWYDSADYQALISLREEAAEATIVAYEAAV